MLGSSIPLRAFPFLFLFFPSFSTLFFAGLVFPSSMQHELKIKTEVSKIFFPAKCIASRGARRADREFSSCLHMQTVLFRQKNAFRVSDRHRIDRSEIELSVRKRWSSGPQFPNIISIIVCVCTQIESFCSSRSILIEQCSSLWKADDEEFTDWSCVDRWWS